MPVKNVTRNTIIAMRSKTADSVLSRSVGLMFSKPTQSAMVLKFSAEAIIGLHTFFVFFPIDILFVDSRLRIVEMNGGMKPFTTYSPKKKAKYVIELPAGTIRKSKTRLGDEVAFLQVVERKTGNGRRITVCRA
ncbi:DUF192 domain-containing protein [Candidatus Woesearchaeota archaeon]|nr:DUF192 domain-containing protein [Candidatus Woesearchaeota archaeon]